MITDNIKSLIVRNGYTIVIYKEQVGEFTGCKLNNNGDVLKLLTRKELDNIMLSYK